MATDQEVDDFLEHFGVKGMKWGVRRNPKTGARPIAKSLSRGPVGKLARANVNAHYARKRKRNNLTESQRRNRSRLKKAAGAIVLADIGLEVVNSQAGRQMMSRSFKTARRVIRPTIDDKLMKNMMKTPVTSFIDVGIKTRLGPKQLTRGALALMP